LAATFIQCSKSARSIVVPSTSATAFPGIPPHPAAMAAGRATMAQTESAETILLSMFRRG
jgi:hypothetical protein